MSCGCSSNYVQCCNTYTNCSDLCNSFVATNSFNIPAIGSNAVLNVANLKQLVVGTYIYNPTYGYLRIVSFDATLAQITVTNDGTYGNAAPGAIVPAATPFLNTAVSTMDTSVVTDFTPTFITTGGLVVTPSSTFHCQYKLLGGGMKWLNVKVRAVLSGLAAPSMVFTLPVASLSGFTSYALFDLTPPPYIDGSITSNAAGTTGTLVKSDGTNFALSDTTIGFTFIYY